MTIALMGTDVLVAMDANKFNYDEGHNLLLTQLDALQIAAQPRVPG